ncbi:hypothetical protein JAAARDRAFT_47662 [Jaapia argillacea MUCL 33604]|uniref:Uncharacterized protein n=1 Tax=Jaapia argillacea MUCL 33604 TaxID=933084 RepID=A0A067PSQ2_9AGAM|nr:hypothetical protein JAAARDRAFT_47662 [Jaapia argillacea MUCL 33604]
MMITTGHIAPAVASPAFESLSLSSSSSCSSSSSSQSSFWQSHSSDSLSDTTPPESPSTNCGDFISIKSLLPLISKHHASELASDATSHPTPRQSTGFPSRILLVTSPNAILAPLRDSGYEAEAEEHQITMQRPNARAVSSTAIKMIRPRRRDALGSYHLPNISSIPLSAEQPGVAVQTSPKLQSSTNRNRPPTIDLTTIPPYVYKPKLRKAPIGLGLGLPSAQLPCPSRIVTASPLFTLFSPSQNTIHPLHLLPAHPFSPPSPRQNPRLRPTRMEDSPSPIQSLPSPILVIRAEIVERGRPSQRNLPSRDSLTTPPPCAPRLRSGPKLFRYGITFFSPIPEVDEPLEDLASYNPYFDGM